MRPDTTSLSGNLFPEPRRLNQSNLEDVDVEILSPFTEIIVPASPEADTGV